METNSWDNFDPSYPYWVSFEDIWILEPNKKEKCK